MKSVADVHCIYSTEQMLVRYMYLVNILGLFLRTTIPITARYFKGYQAPKEF